MKHTLFSIYDGTHKKNGQKTKFPKAVKDNKRKLDVEKTHKKKERTIQWIKIKAWILLLKLEFMFFLLILIFTFMMDHDYDLLMFILHTHLLEGTP